MKNKRKGMSAFTIQVIGLSTNVDIQRSFQPPVTDRMIERTVHNLGLRAIDATKVARQLGLVMLRLKKRDERYNRFKSYRR